MEHTPTCCKAPPVQNNDGNEDNINNITNRKIDRNKTITQLREEEETTSFPSILIEIISYGRRNGKPESLERTWNCTKISNPSSSSRKGRTGLDKRLRSEVMRGELAQNFVQEAIEYCMARLEELLTSALNNEHADDSSDEQRRIRIGFGCEMGKHRSVSIAFTLGKELRRVLAKKEDGNFEIIVNHRDIEGEQQKDGPSAVWRGERRKTEG